MARTRKPAPLVFDQRFSRKGPEQTKIFALARAKFPDAYSPIDQLLYVGSRGDAHHFQLWGDSTPYIVFECELMTLPPKVVS